MILFGTFDVASIYLTFFLVSILRNTWHLPDIQFAIFSGILSGIYLTFNLASVQAFILALILASTGLIFNILSDIGKRKIGAAVPTDICRFLGSRRRRRRKEEEKKEKPILIKSIETYE